MKLFIQSVKALFIDSPYMPVALILTFFVGLLGSYLVLTITDSKKITKSEIKEIQENNLISGAPQAQELNDNSYNILLLGSGGANHSGGGLMDSIIVVNVNPDKDKASLISIPRDLWVSGGYKINAGVTNTNLSSFKGTIQNVTGLPISYVISTDFSEFVKLIDSLGEIEINLDKSYDDNFYPVKGLENETCGFDPQKISQLHILYSGFELEKQFTCRYEHVHADSGVNKINGELALKLARSRHGDSDFGRSQRQFAILKGILSKLISTKTIKDIDDTYYSLLSFVKTDITLDIAKDLIQIFGDFGKYQTNNIYLTDENVLMSSKSSGGAYILIPKEGENNFNGVKNYIIQKITQ